MQYNTPVKKLKIQMAIAEYLVLGSVFMYFDNPATLLILDIIILPNTFCIKCSYKDWSKQLY